MPSTALKKTKIVASVTLNTIRGHKTALDFQLSQYKVALVAAFNRFQEQAAELKQLDPTFVPPWESAPYLKDQRVYQIQNCRDAIYKVLPSSPDQAISNNEVIKRIKALGLTYSNATILCVISTIKHHPRHDDSERFRFTKTSSKYGRVTPMRRSLLYKN